MFRPKKDYHVKKDHENLLRRMKYIIVGIVVFLLGFALAGPVVGLFR